MGTSQSKEKCGCFGSLKERQREENRVRSCVTEVSMEKTEREINRIKARQRIAKQKGYLKYKGLKKPTPAPAVVQAFNNAEQEKAAAVQEILDETVAKAVNISEKKKIDLLAEILDETVFTSVDIAEQKKATAVAEILDEVIVKAVDIAEQKKTAFIAEILVEAVVTAADDAEQQKAVTVTDFLDEVISIVVDISEKEKKDEASEILDQVVATAVDIAECEKAAVVAEIIDEAVIKATEIAEREKATMLVQILKESVAQAVDIAEKRKADVIGEILEEVVAQAVDIAEEKIAAESVSEGLDDAVVGADECRQLEPEKVPLLYGPVAAHDENIISADQEDEVSVKAERLTVPSMTRKGTWVRDSCRQFSTMTKESDVIQVEPHTSLYKPWQLKEAFDNTKTLEEKELSLHQKVSMSPFKDPLRTALYSGKFTILDTRDETGSAIAVFVAQGHSPATSHKVVMNSICIQMNQAVKSPQTQANGFVLLYDFSKADYKASDLRLFAKILQFFKTAYPVPLKRTLLVSAPFWLEAELRLLGLRVSPQDRIEIVTRAKLKECVPVTCLSEDFGGNNHDDHGRWVEQCLAGYSKTFGSEGGLDENEPASPGDAGSGMESDVEEKRVGLSASASAHIIWQPKEFDHGVGLKSIARIKVQENRSAPPNLIWKTTPEKPGQASLKAVSAELKGESKRSAEGRIGCSAAAGNLIWQLNPKKPRQN